MEDPIIIFKNAVEDNMRDVYSEAIRSLNRENQQLRRRYRRVE